MCRATAQTRALQMSQWPATHASAPYAAPYATHASAPYAGRTDVFTAVLYLGDESGDAVARVGGETALVDEMRRDATTGACELSRGVVVLTPG